MTTDDDQMPPAGMTCQAAQRTAVAAHMAGYRMVYVRERESDDCSVRILVEDVGSVTLWCGHDADAIRALITELARDLAAQRESKQRPNLYVHHHVQIRGQKLPAK